MGSAIRDGAILMGGVATTGTPINSVRDLEKAQNELQEGPAKGRPNEQLRLE